MLRRAFALCLFALPAVAQAQPAKTVEPGKLTWGSSPTFTPFEFMRDGKPAGFDVDLMDELARRIGLQSAMLGMDFKGIIPAILGGRIDAGVSGMYITPERQAVADMIPYVRVGNQIIVRKGNPKHIPDQNGLCGERVAVPTGTAFEAAAKQLGAACIEAGKPAIELLSLTGSNVVALALQQGRVDAALNSTATAAAMMGESPDTYELAGPPFNADTRIGIALRKDDPALRDRLAQALQAMVADGSYAALLTKWNLPAAASIF